MGFPANSCSTALRYQPQQRKSNPDNVAQHVSTRHSALILKKTCHIHHSCGTIVLICLTNAARPEHQMVCHPRIIAHLLAVHESFLPMYGDQVIPWTQRKCQAENLSGGGLRVVGQGESSSDQQGKHPNPAHSYPSSPQPNLLLLSGIFHLPVTPSRP